MISLKFKQSKLQALLADQAVLLLNAGALAFGTLFTAILGFAYWWFAARTFSPEAVGFAAAAISLMNLIAHLGEVGLGPLLLGGINSRGSRGEFLSAALLVASIASALCAILCVLFTSLFGSQLGGILESPLNMLAFVAGCAITGSVMVLDQALVGLLRSGLQLMRNIMFAVGKLALLVILGLVVGVAGSEESIYATWILGQLLSLVLVCSFIVHAGRRIVYLPRILSLRPVLREILGHHGLSIAVQAPSLILPFVVTVMLSAEVNAAFYAAWTVLSVSLLVPASLSAVLFTVARAEPSRLPARLRMSLGLSMASGLATAGIFGFLSNFIISLFNPAYGLIGGHSFSLLGFGACGMALKYHYLAIQRIRGRLGMATLTLTLCGAFEIAATVLGARAGGLEGLTAAWVLAVCVPALVLCPSILSGMRPLAPPRPQQAVGSGDSAVAPLDMSPGVLS